MKKRVIFTILEPILILILIFCGYLLIHIFTYKFDINKELAMLPESCTYQVRNWTFERSSSDDMKREMGQSSGFAYSYIGLTITAEQRVMLSENDFEAHQALSHEIGHVCDTNNNFPSKSKEFYEIFLEEAYGYGKSNPQEFFATVYKNLVKGIKNPLTPKANAFVENYI